MIQKDSEKALNSYLDQDENNEGIDPKIVALLKDCIEPIAPVSDATKKKIMDSYRKDYRYRILWRKIGIKIQELKDFILEHLPGKLELAFASIIIVAVLSGFIYYQYINSKNTNQGNLISNQQPSKINPGVTPSTTVTISKDSTPNIAQNDKLNNKTLKDSNNEGQKDSIIASNNDENKNLANKQHRKPETPKNLEREENNVAYNKTSHSRKGIYTNGTEKTTGLSEKSITLANLVNVCVLPLQAKNQESEAIDLEITKELMDAIANSEKWKLSSVDGAEAVFKRQETDGALILVNLKKEILWKDANYIDNYKQNKNYIKSTVKSLTSK